MNKPSQSEVELLAIQIWQAETGKIFGWGSVPETRKYREFALKKLTERN